MKKRKSKILLRHAKLLADPVAGNFLLSAALSTVKIVYLKGIDTPLSLAWSGVQSVLHVNLFIKLLGNEN